MILRLEGCGNVKGFQSFISKSMPLVAQRDDAEDESKIEAILRMIRSEVKAILDLRAMLGFERWQSKNKGLPLGSVIIDHLCGIDGVEASRMEIMFD